MGVEGRDAEGREGDARRESDGCRDVPADAITAEREVLAATTRVLHRKLFRVAQNITAGVSTRCAATVGSVRPSHGVSHRDRGAS